MELLGKTSGEVSGTLDLCADGWEQACHVQKQQERQRDSGLRTRRSVLRLESEGERQEVDLAGPCSSILSFCNPKSDLGCQF